MHGIFYDHFKNKPRLINKMVCLQSAIVIVALLYKCVLVEPKCLKTLCDKGFEWKLDAWFVCLGLYIPVNHFSVILGWFLGFNQY